MLYPQRRVLTRLELEWPSGIHSNHPQILRKILPLKDSCLVMLVLGQRHSLFSFDFRSHFTTKTPRAEQFLPRPGISFPLSLSRWKNLTRTPAPRPGRNLPPARPDTSPQSQLLPAPAVSLKKSTPVLSGSTSPASFASESPASEK